MNGRGEVKVELPRQAPGPDGSSPIPALLGRMPLSVLTLCRRDCYKHRVSRPGGGVSAVVRARRGFSCALMRISPRSRALKTFLPSLLLKLAVVGSLFFFLLLPRAQAQGQGGAIKGEVVTTDDKPVELVSVRIESPEMQGIREQKTDESGRFRFVNLPPGDYVLTAEKEGFKTIIRKGLVVQLGRTIPLKIVLDLPEMGETVEVIERRPTVDTERSEVGATFSDDFLGNLPTGRSFQEVIQFLPGVTGGGNPNIHGATSQANQYFVDGVNTTDPVTNTFSMNFNFDAIKDIEVITAGLSVRYGSALGGIVNIVTKSGGNKFEGDFSGYYTTSALQSRDRYYSDEVTDYYEGSVNAGLGGPIVKDRVWFYVSYQFTRNSSLIIPAIDTGRDLAKYPMIPQLWTSHYLLGKVTWQASDSHKIVVSAQADPTRIENTRQSIYVLPEAENLWDQGGWFLNGRWEWTVTPTVYFTTQIYYQKSFIHVQPIIWKDCNERNDIGACLDDDKQQVPVWPWTGAEFYNGSYGRYDFDNRNTFSVQTDGTLYFDTPIGPHTMFLGIGAAFGSTDRAFSYYTGEVVWKSFPDYDGDGNPDAEEVNDIENYQAEQRAVIINNPVEEQSGVEAWFYIEDEWQPTEGLTIQPGLRIDRSIQRNNIYDNIIDGWAFSPAVQFSWDPFRDRRTLLHGGYRRYTDTGFLAISGYVNRDKFNAEYYVWDDLQHRWGEDGTRAQAPDNNLMHYDLVAASSDEFQVGIQREVQKDLSMEIQYIYRFYRNIWEDDEVNLIWNADGTDVIGGRAGDDATRYRFRTPSEAFRRYNGVEIIVRKNLSDNMEVYGSYTFSRTSGNSDGSYGVFTADFDEEQQVFYQEGLIYIDRPHSVKLAASYNNPNARRLSEHVSLGWALGALFTFESGTPYDKLYYNYYWQGVNNLQERRGTVYRLPATSPLDLRGTLSMTVYGTEIDFIVQVFNLLNSREVDSVYVNATDENGDVATDEDGNSIFGTPVSRQTPRTVQFGLRFQF